MTTIAVILGLALGRWWGMTRAAQIADMGRGDSESYDVRPHEIAHCIRICRWPWGRRLF